jgi:hypothetical protein
MTNLTLIISFSEMLIVTIKFKRTKNLIKEMFVFSGNVFNENSKFNYLFGKRVLKLPRYFGSHLLVV